MILKKPAGIFAGMMTAMSVMAEAACMDNLMADERALPFYTGEIQPVPQQAVYQDVFMPLTRCCLLLGDGLEASDQRVNLLAERIRRYGGRVEIVATPEAPGDVLFLIGSTGRHAELLAGRVVPARPEGYLIHAAKSAQRHVIFLQGHDFHGLLWAITAFNQLVTVRENQPVARGATILDYPDAPGRRAYTPFQDDDDATMAWFGVNVVRANFIQYRQVRMLYRQMPQPWAKVDWRMPLRDEKVFQGWESRIRKIGAYLNPLRIAWCDAMQPLSSVRTEDLVRSKSEEDIHLAAKVGLSLAAAGGHLMIMYDDFRFPIHPDDVRDFKFARAADVYFLNRVYEAVAVKYPEFKIYFCPPFYWGGGEKDDTATYGESRDEYLKAIGAGLPPAIEIFWTGSRVKSNVVTREQVAWITGLIKRKPVFWQNACGTFRGGSPYYAYPGLDPMRAWKDWYYDGFYNDLQYYAYNGEYAYITMTLHDAMWNTQAYDPAASGVMAAKKLTGPDNYQKLLELYGQLEKLDQYGWLTPTALAARNIGEVRAHTARLVELYEAAPPVLKSRWMQLPEFVQWKQSYLVKLMKNPQLEKLAEVDRLVRELAIKETGLQPDAPGLILTPNDFQAGRQPQYYAWRDAGRRHVIWINGARSAAPDMAAVFQLPYALAGGSSLAIAGLDHNAAPPCRIRILMNGNQVFAGANPFRSDRWTVQTFEVKGAYLRDGAPNTLKIENLEDADSMTSAPWFMLNYAVLRPAGSAVGIAAEEGR